MKLILPCGCEIWKEGTVFYYRRCSPKCKFYLYALRKSKERGNMTIIVHE